METKVCSRCGAEKPLDAFHKSNGSSAKHKRQGACKECSKAIQVEYREANPEWYAALKKRIAIERHGISLERFEQLLVEQGGTCACCRASLDTSDNRHGVHIDHSRRCCPTSRSCGSCVRGLLCGGCNIALGKFGDDPTVVANAIEYIRRWDTLLAMHTSMT